MPYRDPDKERRRLSGIYSSFSDGELFRVIEARGQLTEAAQDALEAEMSRRNIGPDTFLADPSDEVEVRKTATIWQFRDLPTALLAKGSVTSAGIECWLVDENLVGIDWFVSNFIGGIKLQVNNEDAGAAAEILDQPIPEHFDFDGAEEYQQPHCPKCQSLDTTFQELYKGLAYISAWLGVPIPVQRSAWKCHACGVEWEADDGDHPAE